MKRQNQYYNLMTMIKRDGMIDTNNGQKEYIRLYQEPIQIGTRLGDLVRSGYLISTPLGKKRNVWTLTQKGIDWYGEEIVIKRSWKVKKTRAESEVKFQCKNHREQMLLNSINNVLSGNDILVKNTFLGDDKIFKDMPLQHTETLHPTKEKPKHTFRDHVKSLLF